MLCINDHIEEICQAQMAIALDSLPAWRREQAMRFKHAQGQKECALSYIELCRALQLAYRISKMPSFDYLPHGKPTLAGRKDIHFSISHCQKAVGCLLKTTPCGLDIERIREAKPDLVEYTMNEEEQRRIHESSRPNVVFTLLWTQKEAVAKALGSGIGHDVKELLSPSILDQITLITTDVSPMGYVFSQAWMKPEKRPI